MKRGNITGQVCRAVVAVAALAFSGEGVAQAQPSVSATTLGLRISGNAGEQLFSHDLHPTVPFTGSDSGTSGINSTAATYALSQSSFRIDHNQARQRTPDIRPEANGNIRFTVTADTPYSVSGTYTADGHGFLVLVGWLRNTTTFEFVFRHQFVCLGTDQTGTIGSPTVPGGNCAFSNILVGPAQGTLSPGNYEFFYQAGTAVNGSSGPDPGTAPALASGFFQVDFGSAPNTPPTAAAGADGSVRAGQAVNLDGTGSSDAETPAAQLAYSWSIDSTSPAGLPGTFNPGGASSTSATPSFTPGAPGSYVLKLTVTDGGGLSNSDTVTVVSNAGPTANAGSSREVPVGQLVTLNGLASSDPEGDALGYAWALTARPAGSAALLASPTSATPTFTPDLHGDYAIQLVVSDGFGASAPASVTITAVSPNTPPTAVAGANQSSHVGAPASLDGTGSNDQQTPSGQLVYAWILLSTTPAGLSGSFSPGGATSDSATPSFTPNALGTYVLQLTVTDPEGLSDSDTVTLSSTNSPPNANAGLAQGVLVGELVTLDGAGSADPDGDAITFAWTLAAKPATSTVALGAAAAATAHPTFTPDVAGEYVFALAVHDGYAGSAAAEVTISAIDPTDFAAARLATGMNFVVGLSASQVTSKGNQTALEKSLAKALSHIAKAGNPRKEMKEVGKAVDKINKALERTDGVVLRGAPDDGGNPKKDYVTDAAAQRVLYQLLRDALTALGG